MSKVMIEEAKRREWLNRDDGTASIDYLISSGKNYIEADLTLRDCSRSITLDFGVSYYHTDNIPLAIEQIKYKLNILKSVINEFETKLLGKLDTIEPVPSFNGQDSKL